jgi:hypothetical protein
MIPGNKPLRLDGDELVVGKPYLVTPKEKIVIKKDQPEYLPVEMLHSSADYAIVDLQILYGDHEKHPNSLPIDGLQLNTIRH